MMFLVVESNLKEGKVYGQECKEIIMCLGGNKNPPTPDPTKEEREEKLEREAQKEREMAERADARQDVLEQNITALRKGTGRRSLLRGSGGGIGFYNEYDR